MYILFGPPYIEVTYEIVSDIIISHELLDNVDQLTICKIGSSYNS